MFRLLLLVIIHCLSAEAASSCQNATVSNSRSLHFSGIANLILQGHGYRNLTGISSIIRCSNLCLSDTRCFSLNYSDRDKLCELNGASALQALAEKKDSYYYGPEEPSVIKQLQPSVCDKGDSEWQLVFKGMAGKGDQLYDMWTMVTWNEDLEVKGNCRNKKVFEAWSSGQLNIQRVKLSLYDHTGVKVELIFNGSESDILSWFDKERLMSSPWNDLKSTTTTNYFSVVGHAQYKRRFLINKNYGGCPNDAGWLIVFDDAASYCVYYGATNIRPAILYSTTTGAVNWNNAANDGTIGRADYLTIHVDTE